MGGLVSDPLGVLLLLFGGGFLVANLIIMADVWRFRRRQASAVLIWALPRPRPTVLPRVIAVGLGGLIAYKVLVLGWPAYAVFGEGMMFLYYAVWYPLSFTVGRGFYREGIWLQRGFVRYADVTALTWRDDPDPTLIVVAGHRQRAGHLLVPLEFYAEARRILRDRISADQLHVARPLLDLGGHDPREDV